MPLYRLKSNILMRGWDKLPYALVDSSTGAAMFLHAGEWAAAQLCDGETDSDLPFFSDETRALLPQFVECGLAETTDTPWPLDDRQRYVRHHCRYIRAAHWSITGRCNYHCRHCYMSAPDAKLGELSHEQAMDIARQIVACGIASVSLTGGEPLVRDDFFDIVDVLLDGGVRISTIYSNGALVTDELLDQLEERGVHPEFNMSHDGVGHHDWLRGVDGAERAVEEAFMRCHKRGFPTGAEMCLHQGNLHTLRETVLKLTEMGCSSLKTNPVSNVGAWLEGGYGEAVPRDELYAAYLDYIPHYYEDGMPLRLQLGGFFSASPSKPDSWDLPSVKGACDPTKVCTCGHARHVMYISPEGRTLPCMSLSGTEVQSNYPLVTELGLAQCISESTYMSLIDTRASEVVAHNPRCAACRFAPQCLCGCRASALDDDPNDILGPDPATCRLFLGGWVPRIVEAVHAVAPDARCRGLEAAGKPLEHYAIETPGVTGK